MKKESVGFYPDKAIGSSFFGKGRASYYWQAQIREAPASAPVAEAWDDWYETVSLL